MSSSPSAERFACSKPWTLAHTAVSQKQSDRWKILNLSTQLRKSLLDRVAVLGDDSSGHTGCVNTLSWAQDGQLLISGGDDTTLRLWRMDQSDCTTDYPFKCDSIIRTGHHANIFNAQMLPFSSRIATVAGDKQVRIFDIGSMNASQSGSETLHTTQDACIRVIRCHSERTKRIIPEESSDLFLTVSEDGTVRQHDLRAPQHTCRKGEGPAPLVKVPHELSTLAMSPLTPYQFVVGGESAFGHLFDRRQLRRTLHATWGINSHSDEITTCVRRFGRKSVAPGGRRRGDHITGAQMAASNGHEVSPPISDAVYLYSTQDEPQSESSPPSPVLPPNEMEKSAIDAAELSDSEMEDFTGDIFDDDDSYDASSEGTDGETMFEPHVEVPIVVPRTRFAGHCNAETVKDGSDDGNFFMWRKDTGTLHGIYEGDGSVVNVIRAHPHLPLLAVSGIDTTIKSSEHILQNGKL
ncbi:WD40 repeat-like protein [Athelia psychrophila]|uniref:WD40 repeat-like protein n=1 Tax=Athelia psychrophila TaxID=1759441 RepID=A0A166VSD9_9AGAM|nr:WD40 repeat-like protein [Fibularhizoctonia sp. CBS 109695]